MKAILHRFVCFCKWMISFFSLVAFVQNSLDISLLYVVSTYYAYKSMHVFISWTVALSINAYLAEDLRSPCNSLLKIGSVFLFHCCFCLSKIFHSRTMSIYSERRVFHEFNSAKLLWKIVFQIINSIDTVLFCEIQRLNT